ncbi:Rab effector Noc2 [Galemys pyrenaicus]|uniref:Rab effector Noc2 n=1 Tax=Galemys pyrenaicus TaxID=202257 RepID=A0A8J6AET4_GALPY|nr:Rab effector Noc2 [Galemys pyrenaicus]
MRSSDLSIAEHLPAGQGPETAGVESRCLDVPHRTEPRSQGRGLDPMPAVRAMADTIFGSGSDQWVCPNDRQLALRAKLQTGWSVHTYQTEKQRKSQCLSPAEVEAILQVIQRAEQLDIMEQQRIGRLVERLETMRRNVLGNGLSQCLLCGEVLGFLGSSSVFCKDCRKVRPRSGPATLLPSLESPAALWLCILALRSISLCIWHPILTGKKDWVKRPVF